MVFIIFATEKASTIRHLTNALSEALESSFSQDILEVWMFWKKKASVGITQDEQGEGMRSRSSA